MGFGGGPMIYKWILEADPHDLHVGFHVGFHIGFGSEPRSNGGCRSAPAHESQISDSPCLRGPGVQFRSIPSADTKFIG